MKDRRTQEYAPDPLVGTVIDGRYRIREVLGEGGMGMVYAATQRDLDREVAVKIMAPEVAARATAIRRFKREAKSVGRLGHPNIVDIFDVGRLADGRPYLVMPRLTGRDLATVLDQDGPVPIERAVALLKGPAAALDLMHSKGIVHRDIKPENLMLHTCLNGEEIVKLLDFGLVDFTSRDLTRLTTEGMVSGTPHYVSPEGAMGRRVDGRSDVYALSVVLFELVTGRVPIDGLSAVKVLRRKTREEPPSLASRGVIVPVAVERAIARGLARRREDRYELAGAMFDDLARALDAADDGATELDLPLPALEPATSPPSPETEPELEALEEDSEPSGPDGESVDALPMRSYPAAFAAAVALAVFFGVVAVWALSRTPEVDPPAPEAAPAPAPAADGDPEPAPAAPSAESTLATGVDPPPAHEVTQTRPAPRPGVAPSPARAASAPTPDGAVAAAHTRAGTRALFEGLAPAAVNEFRAATLADPTHAPAWRGLGLANQRLGRPAEARLAFERYLALRPGARDAAEIRRRLAHLADR